VKRVLVVDDDVAVQRRCRDILEAEGFEVYCESSLGSARRFLRNKAAEALLLDLFLPDGCGFELFASNGDLVHDLPVIGMSAVYQGSANARLLTSRYPMRGVLAKPVGVTALVEVLREVFGGEYPAPPDWARAEEIEPERTVVSAVEGLGGDPLSQLDDILRRNPVTPSAWDAATPVAQEGRGEFVSPLEPQASTYVGPMEVSPMGAQSERDVRGWDPTASVDDGSGDLVSETQLPPEAAEEEWGEHTTVLPRDEADRRLGAMQPALSRPATSPLAARGQGLARSGWDRASGTVPAAPASGWDAGQDVAANGWSLRPRNPDLEGLTVPAILDPRRAPLQGTLEVTPFPSLLAHVARGAWNGSLLLRRDQVKKIVFAVDGIPCAVKSNLLYECLGRILVREGRITEQQCEQSVTRLKTEGRLQGEILVEMGALSAEDVEPALRRQFETKLFDVYAWNQGLYRFRDGSTLQDVRMQPVADPIALVFDGVRRAYPSDRISIDLAPHMNLTPTLLVARRDLAAMELTEQELDWLGLLDGRRTLASIVTVTGGADGAYRLFYALLCLGVLAFRPLEPTYETVV
jgi:DNA-binding NarL/FixJ family response regulator